MRYFIPSFTDYNENQLRQNLLLLMVDIQGPASISIPTSEIVYEDDLYIVRHPSTLEEVLANENMIVTCRLDHPNFRLTGFTLHQLQLLSSQCRKWEIEHKQRLSIFEKATGELCGAFAVSQQSVENHGSEEDFKELFAKYDNFKNLFQTYMDFEAKMKREQKEYFEDLTKISSMHSFAVPEKHRGKKLAYLMNKVAIQQSIKLGCNYLSLHTWSLHRRSKQLKRLASKLLIS